jgi:hypothetical protein
MMGISISAWVGLYCLPERALMPRYVAPVMQMLCRRCVTRRNSVRTKYVEYTRGWIQGGSHEQYLQGITALHPSPRIHFAPIAAT